MPLWQPGMPALQWSVVIGVAVVAAYYDATSRRVPNALTAPVFVAGLIWATWAQSLGGLAEALAAALMLAAPYVLLFVFAGGGAGDAKLMGALGAWLGVVNGAVALAAVALAGAVLSIGYALFRKRLRSVLANIKNMALTIWMHLITRSKPDDIHRAMPAQEQMLTMPYAWAVLVGMCIASGAVQLLKT